MLPSWPITIGRTPVDRRKQPTPQPDACILPQPFTHHSMISFEHKWWRLFPDSRASDATQPGVTRLLPDNIVNKPICWSFVRRSEHMCLTHLMCKCGPAEALDANLRILPLTTQVHPSSPTAALGKRGDKVSSSLRVEVQQVAEGGHHVSNRWAPKHHTCQMLTSNGH